MTLTEIAIHWDQIRRTTESTRTLVLERLAVCDGCAYKRQLLANGGITHQAENVEDSVYYCGQCGCSLWNKLKEEDNNCPIDKWRAVDEPEYY